MPKTIERIQLWTVEIDRGDGKYNRYVNPCQHIDKEGLEAYARRFNMLYGPSQKARVIKHEERIRYGR